MARTGSDILQSPSRAGVRLKKYQERALLHGLALQPEMRIRSMQDLHARLYNKSPEEEKRIRRAFMRKVCAIAACLLVVMLTLMLNFTRVLPLGCGLLYAVFPDGLHITGYTSARSETAIPESRLGVPVTHISGSAFAGNSSLTGIEIPGCVKSIGESAFMGCENLRLIWGERGSGAERFAQNRNIPFAAFGDYEYEACEGGVQINAYRGQELEITVPSYIGGEPVVAFNAEKAESIFPENIRGIVLPEHLKVLPKGLLTDREELSFITFGPELEVIDDGALRNLPAESLALLPSLRRIGAGALYGARLHSLELPGSLEEIGDEAFSLSHLRSIEIPDSVTSMGEGAFYCCIRLESAKLPSGISQLPWSTFEGCVALNSVIIPDSITAIGYRSFSRCESLTELVLPQYLESIHGLAFENCYRLQMLRIPSTLTDINPTSFNGCSNELVIAGYEGSTAEKVADLFHYSFEPMDDWSTQLGISTTGGLIMTGDTEYEDRVVLPSLYLNDDLQSVNVHRIVNAYGITCRELVTPRFLREISSVSFANVKGLESVIIESAELIGDQAFAQCSDLKSIKLPGNLIDIGDYAFLNCTELADIALPDSLETLSDGAFYGCTSLRDIRIPSSLRVLSANCFAKTGVTQITVPGTITLCDTAFYRCENLERAVVEDGVRVLQGSFYGCSALKEVHLPESLDLLSLSTF